MPTKTQIIPYIFYRDVPAALDWLAKTFGFKEEMRTGTPKGGMHGEMSFGGQLIMMGQGGKEWKMVDGKWKMEDGRWYGSGSRHPLPFTIFHFPFHFPKFTLGACWASFGASKYGYSPKPKILAVMFAGNCRRAVLYS